MSSRRPSLVGTSRRDGSVWARTTARAGPVAAPARRPRLSSIGYSAALRRGRRCRGRSHPPGAKRAGAGSRSRASKASSGGAAPAAGIEPRRRARSGRAGGGRRSRGAARRSSGSRHDEQNGGHAAGAVGEARVQAPQRRRSARPRRDTGAGRPQLAHQRGGRDALAGDVADRQPELAAVEADGVVPVTARPPRWRARVARSSVQAASSGRRVRQRRAAGSPAESRARARAPARLAWRRGWRTSSRWACRRARR